MSEQDDLNGDLRAAQELLFAVLNAVGKPVTFSINDVKQALATDKAIKVDLDAENGTWTIQVTDVE